VGGLEVGDGELGVVAEGVEGLVAEELFDVVEVGAGADELGGAGAAEGVREWRCADAKTRWRPAK
jgi:hypothetical protein